MNNQKGQTWIEFIIVTSVFLIAISFIFITASGNLKGEIQKSQMQEACLKTYQLEYLLRSPGVPANWNYSTGFTIFGLNQDTNKSIIVSYDKWRDAKNFSFANVSVNSTPSQSWRISYTAKYNNGTTINDTFGASPSPNAIICTTKVNGLLNVTTESLLASFDLEAW